MGGGGNVSGVSSKKILLQNCIRCFSYAGSLTIVYDISGEPSLGHFF